MRKNLLCATLAAALAAGGSAAAYAAQEQSDVGSAVMHEYIVAEPVEYVIVEPVELVTVVPAEPIVMSYYEDSSFQQPSRIETRVFLPGEGWMLIEADSAFPRGSTQSD